MDESTRDLEAIAELLNSREWVAEPDDTWSRRSHGGSPGSRTVVDAREVRGAIRVVFIVPGPAYDDPWNWSPATVHGVEELTRHIEEIESW